jgi:flagellar biosynthesis protein FlhF
MKIKRYLADSMRAALAQVRLEQGPEAVILSTRRVEDGIEVIAAVDYDEALFVGATQKRMPLAALALAAPATTAVEAPEPPPGGAPGCAADNGYLEMQRELRNLRELMHDEMAHLRWNDRRLREPLQARVLEQLTAMDMAPDIARALAMLAPQRTNLKNESHIPLALLVRHLQVIDKLSPVSGGVIALVGPTGAGKTTTIAKLAARWSMQNGCQDLALVSTDGYRVGAREQLMTYARMLGAPLHTANSGAELAQVLERLQAKKLVLIDTAGMGPRDVRLTEQLAALKLGAAGARVLLTLPAQGEGHALDEIVRSFAQVAPGACILTKIDEAASLGAVLSTVLRHKLKVAYLCNGQRVPEDLHAAHERRVWLVRAAFTLKERAPARADESYFAHHFGRAHAHA